MRDRHSRSRGWVLLAFENAGPDGGFGGVLTDPMPVSWDGDSLVVSTAQGQAFAR